MATFPDASLRNPLAPDCRRCPNLVEDRECIAWGTGPLDADLVVVGEAPGPGNPEADRWRGGNWTGMSYTSRHSGRRIRDMLADAGFGPENCHFTNAVKCFPSDGNGSNRGPRDATDESVSDRASGGVTNREPTDDELANCRPHLLEEIETVEPRVIVPTGKHATESVLALVGEELDGFLDAVLEPIDVDGLDPAVVPILHPSYQDVWIRRLGYEPAEYQGAVEATLHGV